MRSPVPCGRPPSTPPAHIASPSFITTRFVLITSLAMREEETAPLLTARWRRSRERLQREEGKQQTCFGSYTDRFELRLYRYIYGHSGRTWDAHTHTRQAQV